MASAEFQLVVDACRWSFTDGAADAMDVHVEGIDWPLLLKLTRRHRVQALVWHCLSAQQVPVPAATATALAGDSTGIAAANLRATGESARLRELFAVADLPLLFVKGLPLAGLAYPHPFLKMGWDIDLLVAPESIAEAASILRGAGYRQLVPGEKRDAAAWHRRRKESAWRHPEGFTVDLHSRLADHPRLIPGIDVWSPAQQVEVAPGVTLPTLQLDELFAYLCVHGAVAAWFRLKWLADLAALLHHSSPAEVERLYRRSQELGAGRAPAQALLLAGRLFGTAVAAELRDELERDSANRLLERLALAQLAGRSSIEEPTERPFGTVTMHFGQLLLLPGWRFALSDLRRQFRDLVR